MGKLNIILHLFKILRGLEIVKYFRFSFSSSLKPELERGCRRCDCRSGFLPPSSSAGGTKSGWTQMKSMKFPSQLETEYPSLDKERLDHPEASGCSLSRQNEE